MLGEGAPSFPVLPVAFCGGSRGSLGSRPVLNSSQKSETFDPPTSSARLSPFLLSSAGLVMARTHRRNPSRVWKPTSDTAPCVLELVTSARETEPKCEKASLTCSDVV